MPGCAAAAVKILMPPADNWRIKTWRLHLAKPDIQAGFTHLLHQKIPPAPDAVFLLAFLFCWAAYPYEMRRLEIATCLLPPPELSQYNS